MIALTRNPAKWVLALAFAAAPVLGEGAVGALQTQAAATVMDPYVVTAPKSSNGLWSHISRSVNAAVGKKFLNLRGGPLLDAIFYRTQYLRDHPGERAVVLVTSEPLHGRVTSATVAFSKEGRLYASSAALGNDSSLAPLTPFDLDHPEKIDAELKSRREVYLSAYKDWESGGGPSASAPAASPTELTTYSPSSSTSPGAASYAAVEPTTGLIQGAVIAKAEESGDYSTIASSGQQALINEYGFYDPSEQMGVAYSVLHEQTLLPISKTRLLLDVIPDGGGTVPARREEEVVVFDWDGVHYIFNPDLGTFGLRIPRNSITGLPELVVRKGDVLEALYFYATFRALNPAERAILVPARDEVHACVAYTVKGRTWIFSPSLGKFQLPTRLRIDDLAGLVSVHATLVAKQRALGRASPTSSPQELPGDSDDLQVRRAYLALREAGYRCTLAYSGTAPTLTVAWNGGSYAYSSPH